PRVLHSFPTRRSSDLPEAAALRAVNCVVPTADGLVGDNTDGPGFLDALQAELGFDTSGRRVVVVGAGGAARAIVLAAARAGATEDRKSTRLNSSHSQI